MGKLRALTKGVIFQKKEKKIAKNEMKNTKLNFNRSWHRKLSKNLRKSHFGRKITSIKKILTHLTSKAHITIQKIDPVF